MFWLVLESFEGFAVGGASALADWSQGDSVIAS
jgi:hypothetical protein